MLPGWFYLPKLAVSVEFTHFAFRWLIICQEKLLFFLNERIEAAEYVIEGRRNVGKDTRSGIKSDDDGFWFRNRFVRVSCWAAANILVQHPTDMKMNNQPLASVSLLP